MNVLNVPSLQSLIKFHIARHLWGAAFKATRVELANHREKLQKKISKISSDELSFNLKCYLNDGIVVLEQAFNQVVQFTDIHEDSLTVPLFDHSDKYFAPLYFTIQGEFNDVAWVNKYVHDGNINFLQRFKFACNYCLENEICKLYKDIEKLQTVPSLRVLNLVLFCDPRSLAGIWRQKIDKRVEYDFVQQYGRTFWYQGLLTAILNGYEQATYYFWRHLPKNEKDNLFRSYEFLAMFTKASESKFFNIVNFFYRKFSIKDKYFILSAGASTVVLSVWRCLLLSPSTHSSAITDILQSLSYLTRTIIACLIQYLTELYVVYRLPMFKRSCFTICREISKEQQRYVLHYLLKLKKSSASKKMENCMYNCKRSTERRKGKVLN